MWKWDFICWLINVLARNPADRGRRFNRLRERVAVECDQDRKWWTVFLTYPKEAVESSRSISKKDGDGHDKTAIVMQGPVVERDDMTFETLKLYRKTMPRAELILSTWDNVTSESLDRIESIGVHVVTSTPPDVAGPQNLNFQIVSASRGMSEAKRLGCRYAMKTRVDTRIHACDVDQFCRDLLRQFPLRSGDGQSQRLVTIDFATRLYIPYHPSDMMMFGAIDDMLRYWSLELCGPEIQFEACEEFEELLKQPIPEVLLCRRFLESFGMQLTGQLEQWWSVLAERFIVIDRAMINQFWPKYNYSGDQSSEIKCDRTHMALCHFAQWMQIYSGSTDSSAVSEDLQSQKMDEKDAADSVDAAAA